MFVCLLMVHRIFEVQICTHPYIALLVFNRWPVSIHLNQRQIMHDSIRGLRQNKAIAKSQEYLMLK